MTILLSEWARIALVVFDFDGVFTDNTVWVDQTGCESVRCWRSDGLGVRRLASAGVAAWIVSTETNPVVSVRAAKLGVPVRQAIEDKAMAVAELCSELGVRLDDTAFVGNDINDIPAFRLVGFPMAVSDAYPEVLPHVRFVTAAPGGRGAVREVCDRLAAAKGTL